MSIEPIRIGTRGSALALWQANKVKDLLFAKGISSELKIIHSVGDKDRKSKLHEMGLVGVFTKELDDALLLEEIDIAVHSLKDVPTSPPIGIVQCAVLERANPHDILVSDGKSPDEIDFTLATGSLRRRAFWLNRYPSHSLQNLRGNVPTRIEKLKTENIDGIILAKAGVDRLGIELENQKVLEWMTPAPAQGIVGIFCLDKREDLKKSLSSINNKEAEICAFIERQLLKTLEGGCTAPIGAFAKIDGNDITIKSSLLSDDGKNHIYKELIVKKSTYSTIGTEIAKEMLKEGGKEIMKEINQEQDLPKVLCLKKLTPPRIQRGKNHGFTLEHTEVIQTLPEYNSYEVSVSLKTTNNYVFSSLNSVSSITKILKGTSMIHKKIFCVGSRVASFFEGKVKSIHQVNSVSELTEEALKSGETEFVWFHGNKSDMALVEEFEQHEMTLTSQIVYRTEVTEPKIEDLEQYQALLFFSPSGIDSFNSHNYIPEHAVVAAIGKTTALAINEMYDEQENTQLDNIIVPETFEFDHLLAALKAHFKTHGKN